MPGFEELLHGLAVDGQLVEARRLPGRPASLGAPSQPLPPTVASRLPPMWSHQSAALDLLRAGRSVALATGTASGKSLCYQAAIAEAALDGGTALLLFPTKALAQDQLRAFGAFDFEGVVAVTYDGDSSPAERAWARRNANVVLTNPDMLHAGILPTHGRWASFLAQLRYVVLDELHTLRGVFGTHVAHLVRRLRRLCAAYGSAPVFVCCSATIGSPAALASAITGVDVTPVIEDGSPSGARLFALWQPSSASAHQETARLLAALVADGRQAIAFTRSRRGAEVVAAHAQASVGPLVRCYRGGFLASERREIEAALWSGAVRGVAATNALELGVDIGGLDACILDGFPGTIASMWQQAGRAGRAQQESLAVLVAGEDALDQWLMRHPSEVFTRAPEPAVINTSNPFVLEPHVACAAYERPLEPSDRDLWDGELDVAVRSLVVGDELVLRGARVVYAGRGFPAWEVGLRSGRSAEFQIVDPEGRLIGTVDEGRVFESAHPGAVYLHQGQHYRVARLDLSDHVVWVDEADGREWTQARTTTDLSIVDEEQTVKVGRALLSLGRVDVTQQVTGYQRRAAGTGDVIERCPLELPATHLATRAFWYTVPSGVLDDAEVGPRQAPGALHAAEHAAIGMLPLFTICDRWDVGGVSTAFHAQTGEAMIFVYDGYLGGAGIAELGFASGARHLAATMAAIEGCPCETGCPSCIQSPKCGNWNEPLEKAAAVALLRAVLAG
ncbi:MAG TPA: DEAD/DEAH box helicase [Acidimicrobiales bacterium]|nr:DEAD/DEAH box helicase [Acidimicrobiales bacterium]